MPNKAAGKEEEPSFRVTDRRRVRPEGSHEAAQAPESPSERTPESPDPPGGETVPTEAETPPTEQKEKELVILPIPDLVRVFIAELQTRALLHMGLIPNPATRLVAKDLPQARQAIDCMAALIEQISRLAAPAERDELQQMLTNLRLHFVRQSGA